MSFAELLACPTCRGALAPDGGVWRCLGSCAAVYPEVDGIPWLLASPGGALAEWQARLAYLLQRLDADAEALKGELRHEAALPPLTQKRLRKLLQAKVEHRKALTALLAPLAMSDAGSLGLSRAAQVRLPAGQSLTGYYANVHRDWAWDTAENAAGLAAVEAVLAPDQPLGTLLVLGAGAGRLTYDLHRRRRPRLTVAADLNPLMLLAARRILRGKSLKLYEFALAPKDLDCHAVLRRCAAPEAAPDIVLAFADALQPAFADGAFDTVLTPWLIDIVPAELTRLAATVNRLLRPGGTWLNFGSLAFNNQAQALNFSFEEVLEQVRAAGFAAPLVDRRQLPYMQSPASCHGRLETTTAFAAVKEAEAQRLPAAATLPPWLARSDLPVPRLKAFEAVMTVHAILLDALAKVDGQKTLAELAAGFGARHGLPARDAEASLRGVLTRLYEESLVGHQH